MEVDDEVDLARLYAIAVAEVPLALALAAVIHTPTLAAVVAASTVLPLLRLYWLPLVVAASASLVALYQTHSILALAALTASAVAALAAPRQLPRPPSRTGRELILPLTLALLAPVQALLAVHALERVEPYSLMLRGVAGAPGTLFLAASLAVASAAYLAAAPPKPRPTAGSGDAAGRLFEVFIYAATIAPIVRDKAVLAPVLAGLAAGGLASAAGYNRLRLPAYMAAYLALTYTLHLAQAIEAFYTTATS